MLDYFLQFVVYAVINSSKLNKLRNWDIASNHESERFLTVIRNVYNSEQVETYA